MKTTTTLGALLVTGMAALAGCSSDAVDAESSTADLSGGADPTTTDEYAQKVGANADGVEVTGPQAIPIPGLHVSPSGTPDAIQAQPPQATQSKSNPDWVIDLSKMTLFENGNLRIGFDPTSKAVFQKPVVTMDHNIGPGQHFKKRLNHFDAVVSGGAQLRAVVQFETLNGQDAQFWTGKSSDSGETSDVPDPEVTIPLFDQPLVFPVLGVPVQVHPTLTVKVGCHLELAVNGVATAGAEYAFSFKKGIEFNFFRRYSKDPAINFGAGPDTWGPEHDDDFSGDHILNLGWFHLFPDELDANPPKMIASATAKGAALANCWVEPQLSVSLYEMLGGTARLHPYVIGALQADTEKDPPVDYAVTYGMKGGVSAWARLPILGKMSSGEFQLVDVGGGEGQTVRGSFSLSN
jgi:hypothetical protein